MTHRLAMGMALAGIVLVAIGGPSAQTWQSACAQQYQAKPLGYEALTSTGSVVKFSGTFATNATLAVVNVLGTQVRTRDDPTSVQLTPTTGLQWATGALLVVCGPSIPTWRGVLDANGTGLTATFQVQYYGF